MSVIGPSAALVELAGITKRFPGVVANDDVSLAFHAGEVHALLGENGAGKSTLIAILSGVLRPDSGTIRVRGRAVAIESPRAALALGIGTVYQHSTLVPTMTVAENLMLGQSWRSPMNRAAMLRRLDELARVLGIRIEANARAGDLALGQQQQIEIVKALWRGEQILVLDEPTSMLTPQGVAELGGMMRRLSTRGIAIVFVTHKLDEVLAFGDRVSILKLGRLVETIAPERFRKLAPEAARGVILARMFGRDAPTDEAGAAPARASAAPDRAKLLVLDNVATEAGRGDMALADIGFAVAPGDIFGIAGVDGNGQKELAEVIAGQRVTACGAIHMEGADITRLSVDARQRLGICYLTDDRLGEGTVGPFSVALNFVLKRIGEAPFWRRGIVRHGAIMDNATELVARYDVRAAGPEAPIATLSGGNVQKALFARELSMAPKLVVYNKPTYGLDVANIRAARRRIREAAAAGVAAILISTDLDELLELCDRVGVMNRGRLVGIVSNGLGAEAGIGALMVAGAPS